MLASSIPAKFPLAFGQNAAPGFINPIPVNSQIGINPGFASLNDGFVPLNGTPVAAGGVPPREQDMNGILNQVSAWCQWQQAGGPVKYDGAFAAAIGGYPADTFLQSAVVPGNIYMSLVDNNTTDPDSSGSAGWCTAPGTFGTGDTKWRPDAVPQPGWALMNSTTIGNAASGATQLASAQCAFLFAYLWNNFSPAQCPVYLPGTSTPTTRGATPAADFAAGKHILVLDMHATLAVGNDAMGAITTNRFAGTAIFSGSYPQNGAVMGAMLNTLTAAQLAAHTHSIAGSGTTSTESNGHIHGVTGGTGIQSADHVHQYTAPLGPVNGYNGANLAAVPGTQLTTTGGISANHTHLFGVNSGDVSALHTHTFGFSGISGSVGSGAAVNNVQLCMLGSWWMKL